MKEGIYMKQKTGLQMSSSLPVMILLNLSGGTQDACSYFLRDHVFANAQTGNIVLMGCYLISEDLRNSIRYFLPVAFFALGVLMACLIHSRFRHTGKIHGRHLVLTLDIILLFIVVLWHLEWSSLPVGGESTHCVLSGHRGLPSAKLFTNLDKLVAGDKFIMRVLDEVLTYEVDQILIVQPTDVSTLMIEAGKDLCTLVTCTPYGINSHRLLVRGHRIENQDEAQAIRVTSDAIQIEPLIVAPAVALPMLLVLLVILLVSGGKTKSAGGKKNAKTE